LAACWKNFAQTLGLTNDDFVRTTDVRHKEIVQAILTKLNNEGHFYKAIYKGFYSPSAETFLTEPRASACCSAAARAMRASSRLTA
jgi:methionyl-tRNA synthetase